MEEKVHESESNTCDNPVTQISSLIDYSQPSVSKRMRTEKEESHNAENSFAFSEKCADKQDNGDDGGTSAGKASQPIPAENCNEKIQNQPDLPKNDGPSPSAGESSQISDQPLPPNANANVSKKYLKRLAKKAQFGEKLKEKRRKTKLKKKEMKSAGKVEFSRKMLKQKTMKNSNCQVHVVVDLSFDHLMIEKDVSKCVKQIHRCYSINRRQPDPLQLHVTSFNGESAKMMEKHDGFRYWDMFFHEESYDELFPKESLVYLTSESENVVETLDNNKYYIIGGLVDHNSQKGLCHKLAKNKNIQHGRLPIDKYLEMKTRKILSIDHVFEIMASVCQGVSWQDALMKVIPQRKEAYVKGADVASLSDSRD